MMHVLPMLLEYTLQFLTHLIRAPTQELTDDVVAPAKEDAMANDESVPAPDMPKEVSDAANAAAPDAAEILKEASDAANAAAPAPAAEVSLDATENWCLCCIPCAYKSPPIISYVLTRASFDLPPGFCGCGCRCCARHSGNQR